MSMDSLIEITPVCGACAGDIVYDKDGSLSQNGFECWYCPDCYWWSDDWQKYPRPKKTTT